VDLFFDSIEVSGRNIAEMGLDIDGYVFETQLKYNSYPNQTITNNDQVIGLCAREGEIGEYVCWT